MTRGLVPMACALTALTVCAALTGCGAAEKPAPPPGESAPAAAAPAPTAEAVLESRSGSDVAGTATFTEMDGVVAMVVEATGLTPGEHAIHLHEVGDCSAPDAMSAGGHWNPTGEEHGQWGHDPFHRGDIGNLVADDRGVARLTFESEVWTIGGDPGTDVVGRAVILHASADDFTTQPTGNAGGRVACGVVRRIE